MKHNANARRGRNRGNGGKRHIPLRNQTFESSGPDGKIRGTAQQVLDRYLALGRDAYSAGDPIAAEAFYQHAEHYHRMLRAEAGEERGPRPRPEGAPDAPQAEDGAVDQVNGETLEEGSGRIPA
ncbi:MAG: DUF4167 domain-containing protein [Rhodospirillales bacterium]|nr:DUF4167 domain-containing protein [Rhodospirillales bacterium]